MHASTHACESNEPRCQLLSVLGAVVPSSWLASLLPSRRNSPRGRLRPRSLQRDPSSRPKPIRSDHDIHSRRWRTKPRPWTWKCPCQRERTTTGRKRGSRSKNGTQSRSGRGVRARTSGGKHVGIEKKGATIRRDLRVEATGTVQDDERTRGRRRRCPGTRRRNRNERKKKLTRRRCVRCTTRNRPDEIRVQHVVNADIVVDNCAICRNHIMDLCA